jgi:hypothetical protein
MELPLMLRLGTVSTFLPLSRSLSVYDRREIGTTGSGSLAAAPDTEIQWPMLRYYLYDIVAWKKWGKYISLLGKRLEAYDGQLRKGLRLSGWREEEGEIDEVRGNTGD